MRNGWKEESLGLSFGYFDEPLVLPKEVEGYLINKYKPIFNASTPNFEVVSSVNEIGSFDLPMVSFSERGLIDRNGSRIPEGKAISFSDLDIEWQRYLENLPNDTSDQACLTCNKLIDETVPAFITDVIRFKIEYVYQPRRQLGEDGPDKPLIYFSANRNPTPRVISRRH